jgi:K+-sensing histidine kinase KdpD
VFEPFVQVSGAVSADDGVGLGLSISRDLARAMGGDIVVRSELGVGSTFTVTRPAARYRWRGAPRGSVASRRRTLAPASPTARRYAA